MFLEVSELVSLFGFFFILVIYPCGLTDTMFLFPLFSWISTRFSSNQRAEMGVFFLLRIYTHTPDTNPFLEEVNTLGNNERKPLDGMKERDT